MAGKPLKLLPPSNLAVVDSMPRTVVVRGREAESPIEIEAFDLDHVTAVQIAEAMTVFPATGKAADVAQAIATQRGAIAERAVYVVATSNPNISKIGVAGNPLARVSELQVAHWDSLRIAGLLWIYGSPYPIEQRALQYASAIGARIRGEWVRLSVIEAAKLVAEAALGCGEKVADSDMWLRNRARVLNATIEQHQPDENISDWKLGCITAKYDNIANFSERQRSDKMWSRKDR